LSGAGFSKQVICATTFGVLNPLDLAFFRSKSPDRFFANFSCHTLTMEQPKSINWFSRLWWLWAAIAGFLCGYGYEILDYPQWHYSVFLHCANDEQAALALTCWLILGPLPVVILAITVVGGVRWWLRRKNKAA